MKRIFTFFFLAFLMIHHVSSAQGWSELGNGSNALSADSTIYSICTDPSGNVYAAGLFKNSSHKCYVAKWDGTKWSELGTGTNALNPNNMIRSICSDPSGNIYAAGFFTDSTGFYVAKFDGTKWTALGTGSNALPLDGFIFSICSDKSGNIYAAVFGSTGNVAKWDGSTWTVLGSGSHELNANGTIWTICADNKGHVYAGGQFLNSSELYEYIAVWDGTRWSELGSGTQSLNANGEIRSIVADTNGNVYAAGGFTTQYTWAIVAKWDGSSWNVMGPAIDPLRNNLGEYLTLCLDKSGNIYASGGIKLSSGGYFVEKWNGTNWDELGTGNDALNANNIIYSLCSDPIGNVYAAGHFKNANGKSYVAKYTSPNGIDIPADENIISLYPNPSDNFLNIKTFNSNSGMFFHIKDLTGREALSGLLTGQMTSIDIHTLVPGIYFLNLDRPTGQSIKFLVSK